MLESGQLRSQGDCGTEGRKPPSLVQANYENIVARNQVGGGIGDTYRKELLDFFNSMGAMPRLEVLVWSLQLRVNLEGKNEMEKRT